MNYRGAGIKTINLVDLEILKEWGYSTYFSLYFSLERGDLYYFDGYQITHYMEDDKGINPLEIRLLSFDSSIKTEEILKTLYSLNKVYYSNIDFITVPYTLDALPGANYNDMLSYLIWKIDYTSWINYVDLSKSYYNTAKKLRYTKDSSHAYEDKDGVFVHSFTADSVLHALSRPIPPLDFSEYLSTIKGKQLFWMFETAYETPENKKFLEDIKVNNTLNLLVGDIQKYVILPNNDIYNFHEMIPDKVNIIQTQWGRVAIEIDEFYYENTCGDDGTDVLNNIVQTKELNSLNAEGCSYGAIEVTSSGINIHAKRYVTLNEGYLGELNIPFQYCRCEETDNYGGFVALTYDEFKIYIEAGVIPHLYHNINVRDWYSELKSKDYLEDSIAKYAYKGIK